MRPKELTLCKNCWCETKTIDYKIGKCGKCGQTKYQKKFSNLVKKLLTKQRTELLEKIMVEIEIMRGHKDDKIGYLPLYKFLDKLEQTEQHLSKSKDKLGDAFTKFLESEGYEVRDCEVEK